MSGNIRKICTLVMEVISGLHDAVVHDGLHRLATSAVHSSLRAHRKLCAGVEILVYDPERERRAAGTRNERVGTKLCRT